MSNMSNQQGVLSEGKRRDAIYQVCKKHSWWRFGDIRAELIELGIPLDLRWRGNVIEFSNENDILAKLTRRHFK